MSASTPREAAAEAINVADGPARLDGSAAVEAIEGAGLTIARATPNDDRGRELAEVIGEFADALAVGQQYVTLPRRGRPYAVLSVEDLRAVLPYLAAPAETEDVGCSMCGHDVAEHVDHHDGGGIVCMASERVSDEPVIEVPCGCPGPAATPPAPTGEAGAGAGRHRCVIDGCAWAMVDANVRTDLPDGRVIAAPGDTLVETVARAQSRAVERELRLHLESHDLTEFVASIMSLRGTR